MTECEFQWFHGDYEVTNISKRYGMAMSKTGNGTSILTLHIGKSLKRDEGKVCKDLSYLFIDDEYFFL